MKNEEFTPLRSKKASPTALFWRDRGIFTFQIEKLIWLNLNLMQHTFFAGI